VLQTDNHASTPLLSFLQAGCPSCHPTNSVKALKVKHNHILGNKICGKDTHYTIFINIFITKHQSYFKNKSNFGCKPAAVNYLTVECKPISSAKLASAINTPLSN